RTLTGAWIETLPPINNNHNHMVAPSRVRGLKLLPLMGCVMAGVSHPHGCVD
ncbi:hypothetical protein HMPREF3038_02711, partial [Akkermansia sp. KLE1797]